MRCHFEAKHGLFELDLRPCHADGLERNFSTLFDTCLHAIGCHQARAGNHPPLAVRLQCGEFEIDQCAVVDLDQAQAQCGRSTRNTGQCSCRQIDVEIIPARRGYCTGSQSAGVAQIAGNPQPPPIGLAADPGGVLHPETSSQVTAECIGCFDDPGFDHDLPHLGIEIGDMSCHFCQPRGNIGNGQRIADVIHFHRTALAQNAFERNRAGGSVIQFESLGLQYFQLGDLLVLLQLQLFAGGHFFPGRNENHIACPAFIEIIRLQHDIQRLIPGNIPQP